MRKPFFRTSHKAWYFKNAQGRFVRLDADEDTAWEIWRQMQSPKLTEGQFVTVITIIALYLDEHDHKRENERFAKTDSRYIKSFLDEFSSKRVEELKQADVRKWLTSPKPKVERWSARTQLDAYNAVKAVFNWARDEGKITKNPLARIKLPRAKPRSHVVKPDDYRTLMLNCGPALRGYLIASRSGARPRQIRELTKENVSRDFKLWVFQDHKTAETTGKPLVVYLPPCVQTLTRILVHFRSDDPGLLFRNEHGTPWKKDTLSQLFRRKREKLNLPNSIIAYAMRHSFATDSLLGGATLAETALLLGHVDTRMVSKVYGHLDQYNQHMIDAATKASKGRLTQ